MTILIVMNEKISSLFSNSLGSRLGTHSYFYRVGGKLLVVSTNASLPVSKVLFHTLVSGTTQLRGTEDQEITELLHAAFPKAQVIAQGETVLETGATVGTLRAKIVEQLSSAVLSEEITGTPVNRNITPVKEAETYSPPVDTGAHTRKIPVIVPSKTSNPFTLLRPLQYLFNWIFDSSISLLGKILVWCVIAGALALPVVLISYTNDAHTSKYPLNKAKQSAEQQTKAALDKSGLTEESRAEQE